MNQSNTMKNIPDMERPYEKFLKSGAAILTDAELLAIVLRTGSRGENVIELAKRILYHSGEDGILGLHRFSMERLVKIRGIGKVKAMQLICILELSKRLSKASVSEAVSFTSPSSIAEYYMEDLRHESQEIMKLIMINSKGKLIGEYEVSKGTVNASIITPREIFIEALHRQAVAVIALHNHPSGDPSPSKEDILLTRRVEEAGSIIGVKLLDHIIIGNNCYVSLREEGILEKG